MKRTLFLLFVCGLLFCGCKRKTPPAGETLIEYNPAASLKMDDLFSDYRIVNLQLTDSSVMGMPRTVKIRKGILYVSDGTKLFQYAPDGTHLRTLAKRGRGPQEYYDIADFDVSDDEILILDRNKKVTRYRQDNSFYAASHLNFFAASLHVLSDSTVLLTSACQEPGDKFHVFDLTDLSSVASFQPVSTAEISYRHFMGQDNFHRYGDRLLFHEPLNNTVCEIRDDRCIPYRRLNLCGSNPPEEFWSKTYKNVRDIAVEAEKKGYAYGMPVYAENDGQMLFTFRKGNEYLLCSYAKESKKAVQSEFLSLSDSLPPVPVADITISTSSPDCVLLTIPKQAFFTEDGKRYSHEFPDMRDDGNPAVCVAVLK